MRSLDEIGEHVRGLVSQAEEIRSELRDVDEISWGEAGFVTVWLEQDYTSKGERRHVSAPSSAVVLCEAGDRRMVLFLSCPLPAEAVS